MENNLLDNEKSNLHFPIAVLSLLIVVLGTIFSKGEAIVILLSIFVGGFIYLLFAIVITYRSFVNRDDRLNEIQFTINQMLNDIQEMKDKNK